MMKIFGMTFGRKRSNAKDTGVKGQTSLDDRLQPPAAETASSSTPASSTTSPTSTKGEMATNLSADVLMPETRNLLKTLSQKIGFGTQVSTSPRSSDDPNQASLLEKPQSDGMKSLLNDLSKRLFPHRHTTEETSINASALLGKLRDDLKNLTPKLISEITPPSAELDETAQNILARAQHPDAQQLGTQADSSKSSNLDGTAGVDANTAPQSVGGDTKPEHASKEALANPFSLVNINRGAASAIPIAPGAGAPLEEDTQKKRSRRKKPAERSTVNYKKKLQQSRFSRRRFLREYGGTTILGAIFSLLLLIGFTVGTIFTNVSVIMPQTRVNQDAGKQSEAFRNEIDRNQPKLSGLLKRRQDLDQKLEVLTGNFVDVNQIRDDFTAFLNTLDEDTRVTVSEQSIEAIDNELPNIQAINVSFKLETSFLLWLKFRNQMIRKYEDINVIEETITAPPGVPTVNIYIKMSRPGRSS